MPRSENFELEEPVVAVRLIQVPAQDFDRVFGKIASFMASAKNKHPGCLSTDLFAGENSDHILIVSKFASREAWIAAQWDTGLAELHEEAGLNAETIHFELYREHNFQSVGL
jgi:quinol monooxygenase YgiN